MGSATEIELFFDWDNRRIIIADNGMGMNYNELMDAMEIGSADPNEMRPSEDLGRFGLGMKGDYENASRSTFFQNGSTEFVWQ